MSTAHRFWVLTGLRWLATGLILPVVVLLPLERGLSLTQLGGVLAIQGLVVLALELPTGGFADSLGRRPMVLAAAVMSFVAYLTFSLAPSVGWFAVAVALTGVFRALDSGPLSAWFVDRVHSERDAAPDAVARGLSGASAVTGLALGVGSLMSAGLIAWLPTDRSVSFAVPYWAAAALAVVQVVAVVVLMDETRPAEPERLLASVRRTPATIAEGVGLLMHSRVLAALVAVEIFWGFGTSGFEIFMPVRLSDLLDDRGEAATVLGPVSAVAWVLAALGATAAPWLARRWGIVRVCVTMRLVQGATVMGMGLAFGPVGLVVAYLATYAVHSASNALYETLLHEQVDSGHRATVLSLASMASHPAGSVAAITLGALAADHGSGAALVVAGVVLALAAPLFLVRGSGVDEIHDVGDGVVDRRRPEREPLDGRGGRRAAQDQEGAQPGLEA